MKVKLQKSVRVKFKDRNTIELVVHDARTDSWQCFRLHLEDESIEEANQMNPEQIVEPDTQENSSNLEEVASDD